jgi:hypothetical protein
MGIQGFFSYLEKNCKTAITEILPLDKVDDWQTVKNITKFDVILIDFQSVIYTILNKYSQIDLFMFYLKNNNTIDYITNQAEYDNRDFTEDENRDFTEDEKTYIYNQTYYLNSIMNTYPLIFEDYSDDLSETKLYEYIKNIDLDRLQNILIKDVFKHTLEFICDYKHISDKEISDEHIETKIDKLLSEPSLKENIKIYFDGIPSMSKIKEQLSRRIEKTINGHITYNLKKIIFGDESNIFDDFITNKSISIGHNTEIVKKLRQNFKEKGITCNDIEDTIDEAEHQIMNDIYTNKEIWKDKNIVILSPDADLIILGLIQNAKYNLNIYIHKLETINVDHYNFEGNTYIKEYYIDIKLLQKDRHFNINNTVINNQQLLDLCYILLLIGDDFLPAIPTLHINAFLYIKNALDNIIKLNQNFKIVEQCGNNYVLNYYNFMRYIKELQKSEITFYNDKDIIKINTFDLDFTKRDEGYSTFQKYLFNYIFYLENNQNVDYKSKIEKYLYFKKAFNNGIFLKKNSEYTEEGLVHYYNKFSLLKGKHNFTEVKDKINIKDKDNNIIKNYLQGCNFIFDLYFNNKINNYQWYYKYHDGPILENILTYFKINKNIASDFYIIPSKEYFKTSKAYQEYSELNKNNMLKDIINNIIINSKEAIITELSENDLHLYQYNEKEIRKIQNYTSPEAFRKYKDTEILKDGTQITPEILQKYLIYSNIPIIYNCFNKKYINKCIDINTELLDFFNIEKQSGGYKEKYLKYKTKYLKLKQSLN